MNDLLQTRLFYLLSESSQVANEEMKNAYEDFLINVEKLDQSETDLSKIYRIQNITRIEFQTLQMRILYEQGEKCT